MNQVLWNVHLPVGKPAAGDSSGKPVVVVPPVLRFVNRCLVCLGNQVPIMMTPNLRRRMPSWLTPLDGITKRSARLKERLVVVCASTPDLLAGP